MEIAVFYKHKPPPPQIRTRCRNVRCGAPLKTPTPDRKVAFCCEACERAHFATRCRVCESAIGRKTRRRVICWRSTCRHELQRHPERYFGLRHVGHNAQKTRSRYPSAPLGHNAQENPAKSKPKNGAKSGRGWRHIAGPKGHEINRRIPLDIPASKANKAFEDTWRKAKRRAARRALIKRTTPPVNIIGGYRSDDDSSPIRAAPKAPPEPSIGDSLDIAAFLRRQFSHKESEPTP